MTPRSVLAAVGRVAVVALLSALLVAQFVWFGAHPPVNAHRSLSGTQLDANYDRYVGQRGELEGQVVATEPVTIAIDRDDTNVRMTVRGLDKRATVGDTVRVYGLIQPDHEIDAIGAVVVPSWGLAYSYAVSLVAGVGTLLWVLRYWRFDVGSLAIERRERPLGPPTPRDDA